MHDMYIVCLEYLRKEIDAFNKVSNDKHISGGMKDFIFDYLFTPYAKGRR